MVCIVYLIYYLYDSCLHYIDGEDDIMNKYLVVFNYKLDTLKVFNISIESEMEDGVEELSLHRFTIKRYNTTEGMMVRYDFSYQQIIQSNSANVAVEKFFINRIKYDEKL